MKLRLAEASDCKAVFDLNTDDLARENSFNTSAFSFENHAKWYAAKIQDPASRIIVFEIDDNLAGLVRLDLFENSVLIGINLNPRFRGKGHATSMIEQAAQFIRLEWTAPIIAQIKKENLASIRTFEKAGFIFDKYISINEYNGLQYILQNR